MENFDFNNIEKYLRDGGDPKTIANAFADKLNLMITTLQDENELKECEKQLSESWNNYANAFFKTNKLPKDTKIEDWYMSTNEVADLFKTIINVIPYVDKWMEFVEKGINIINKAEDTISNTKSSINFDAVAEKFFSKNNIK